MDVGYIRVSSVDQNTDRQLDGVLVQKTFEEKVSGATMDRPQCHFQKTTAPINET